MSLLTPSLATDSFTLNYASNDATATVKVKEATIAIMALASLT
jgi:hypothetical protein